MPKLLTFAPCEKVILDQDNNASLIALLSQITVSLVSLDKLPEGAKSPMRWYIFTLWAKEPDDEGKRYEQACDLVLPDGRIAVPSRTTFKMEGRAHRNIVTVHGFPISRTPGDCTLRLSLREDIEGSEWHEVATYPLLLRHALAK